MARRACDGAGLLGAFRAAVANLEAHVEEINNLNVFPVPDGDTGSNMLATVRAALVEAENAGVGASAERVAAAASFGALMGARGNSGVITSQILRGIAEGLAGKTRFNALDLANALERGTSAAYGAVARPVEGTILTVVREASAAAVTAAEHSNDLEATLASTVEAAAGSVARTPTLLQILRDAGVVDSGGQGLFRLMEGALAFTTGRADVAAVARAAHLAAPIDHTPILAAGVDEGYGYETMFLLQALPGASLDVDGIRTHLESIGDSVLVAGDALALKVHVHNERPDLVIGYGLGLGSISRITVENLDNQATDVREKRAEAFTGASDGATAEADGDAPSTVAPVGNAMPDDAPSTNGPAGPIPALAVVAVTAGEGLAAIFRDFGVARVVMGGQAANPSTGELLEAVRSVNAREVLILPNNPNVVLAARQVAAMSDRPVGVVATRNAAEGFAALLALDPTADAAANAASMTAAGRALQTMAVTVAVRKATIGTMTCESGQVICLDPDDGLLAVHDDPDRAILSAIGQFAPGKELVTIYYGEGTDLATTEELARKIGAAVEGVEVEVVHGGQPHYRYLISAE